MTREHIYEMALHIRGRSPAAQIESIVNRICAAAGPVAAEISVPDALAGAVEQELDNLQIPNWRIANRIFFSTSYEALYEHIQGR